MLAVRDEKWEIVKMLIEHGVDLFKSTKEGKTISSYLGENDERVKEVNRLINEKVPNRTPQRNRTGPSQQPVRGNLNTVGRGGPVPLLNTNPNAELHQKRIFPLPPNMKQERAAILKQGQTQPSPNSTQDQGRIPQLESLLNQERQKNSQLALQLKQEREKTSQLESLLKQEREKNSRNSTEIREIQSMKCEIDAKRITILKEVGSGNFGQVYKGTLDGHPVALKSLTDENQVQDFFKEVVAIKSTNHPYIVRFYGIAKLNGKLNLVTEFCDGGSLKDHLPKMSEFCQQKAVDMALEIAKGVLVLHEENLIHRDLATRNVLVSTGQGGLVMKVADFGMSRKITDYYTSNQPNVPARWCAPESLQQGKFSKSSDVWSFGITLWEIFEQGSVPFGGIGASDIAMSIINGMTLKIKPDLCLNDEIWTIMQSCWKPKPTERPTMATLVEELQKIYDVMPA
eukprot:TRINITY_DN6218_c0_g1_i1.p1 TRINITY_DN6218_c0_g1~~TRINITY_DN6218_c0_g1_i1.p1  ORF type:complete len:456 (-),score=89.60 TRINITY_DN6218_c0_g1_i1:66-1433(-)